MAGMLTDLDRLHTRLFVLLLALVVALVALLTACGSWKRESGGLVGALVSGPQRPGPLPSSPYRWNVFRRLSDGELRLDEGWGISEYEPFGHVLVMRTSGTTGLWLGSAQWVSLIVVVSPFREDLTPEQQFDVRRKARDLYAMRRGIGGTGVEADRIRRLATEDVHDAWFKPVGAALEFIASILAISIVVVGTKWLLVAVRVARMPRGIAGRRPLREICGRCGYDVRGLSVCPECGNGRRRGDPTRRET